MKIGYSKLRFGSRIYRYLSLMISCLGGLYAQSPIAISNPSFEEGFAVAGVPLGWELTAGDANALGVDAGGSIGSRLLWLGPDVSIRQDLDHRLTEGEELTLQYSSSRGLGYARRIQLYAKDESGYGLMTETIEQVGDDSWPVIEWVYQVEAAYAGQQLALQIVGDDTNDPDSNDWNEFDDFRIFSNRVPVDPYAWFRADQGVSVDTAGRVTSWVRQTSSGANLDRVVGAPVRITLPRVGGGTADVIRFDGDSALWSAATSFGSLAGDRTVVVHARLPGLDDGFLFDGSTRSGITRAQVRDGSWQAGVQAGDFSSADPETAAITTNLWQTHIFQYDENAGSTVVTHWIDGDLAGSQSVGTDASLGGLIVGQNGSTAMGLELELAELIVYDQLLDESQRANVAAEIQSRWGDLLELPFTYESSTVLQNSTNVGAGGVYGLVALEIISSGSSPGEIVTGVDFNLNGTTDPSDIRELRLYSSNSSEFSLADALLLATASAEAGRFDINAPITSSTHYLWLAAELAGTSDDADVLDAEITGFTLAGVSAGRFVPAITSPDGFLTVQRNGFHSLVIRRQGDDGVNTYRIPGLATSNDGTLLAVFDIRNDGSGDLPGNIDVGLMRSTDGGYTWGAMQAIMDFDAGVSDSSGNGVGDPAILVDRVNGRIWCAALGSFGNNAWNGSGPGLTKEETGQFYLSYSDDDGVTWSEPYSITSQIKEAAWNLYFMGPGKGICLRDGTLIFPAQYRDASGVAHANFIYSTDRGQTWQNSPPAYVNGSEWTSEAQMVELDNGDLLISMRNYLSRKERLWNIYSWDQENESIADGRWGDAWYNETDPTVMASVETYSSMIDGDPWSGILFANPDSTSRDKMTIRLSLDQGQSWPYRRKIDDRPAAYSCMTILPDGDIGILYETGDANAYQTLTFARFPLDWIVGNEDTDGDGVSDFEEMARRGPPKSLTELRSVAPVSLIPFPRDLLWLNDDCNTSRVVIERPAESGPVLDHAETRLRDALLAAGSVFTEADGSETCVIRLIIGAVPNPDGSDEVYLLETAADSVTIRAPTEAGLLYGVQTLEQLVMADQSGPRIAACSIIDWPAFGIRGFMHDVGRNFQPIELLKKQVDAFARYKLNFFHWHLTENAAWRIESKLYPQLTDAAYHWETREPGQFYTQQEIVDFVNYCAERNITVIPEIDIPGHSEAFRRAMNVTMGERAAVDILVALTNELCDLLPADLVPYIHFGTDEVRIAAENPHPDLIPSLVSTARNRGRKVITWWSGITPVDNQVINQLWASYAPRANNPYIDSRSNYINHLDAFDGPIRAYFQQVCRVPKETDQALGGILCYWPDVNIDDPFHGLGIVPVFPTMVTYSERVWRGADRDYPEYWAKLPPADSPLFEEFAEFEKDLLSHRDRYFSGELPFPYVSQTQLPWKIVGPFDHGGNLAQSFGPEEEILPSYASGGQTLAWSDALGGTIHLDHFFGFESYSSASVGTYYAMTQVVSDTDREVDFWFQFGTPSVSRRRNGGNPPLGEWNAYEAKVWVNGESIDPPIWQNPGLLPDFGDEIPFTNEGYFYREPTRVTLKAGSNQILLRIPQGANNGFPAGKWMFSAMPIAWDGSQASELEGISFQAEVPELLPTRIEKDSADLEHRFEGNDIYNGSSYINGWTEWNSGAASESLSDSDLNRTHTNGSESWIGGATMSKDGVNTWDSGNGGDWTLELRIRLNECSNGYAFWLGTGSNRIIVEAYPDRTQDYGAESFVAVHNNEDGNFHVFRVSHDSAAARYHVWRDGMRLTPIQGAPYDASASDNRLILGDYTSGIFGNNANVDIDYLSFDFSGDYLPFGADADRDGMPDAWEFLYFNDITAASRDADNDGDGYSNFEEYLADTRPGDRGSRLQLLAPVRADMEFWELAVPNSSPDRLYTLESTHDLGESGSWQVLPEHDPARGNGGILKFNDISSSSRRFYRVRASLP